MGEINNDSKKQPHVKETANSQRGDSLWSSTLVISAHNGDIVGSVENEQLERRLKWKLDLIILPILSTIYFFAAMVSSLEPPYALLSSSNDTNKPTAQERNNSNRWKGERSNVINPLVLCRRSYADCLCKIGTD